VRRNENKIIMMDPIATLVMSRDIKEPIASDGGATVGLMLGALIFN